MGFFQRIKEGLSKTRDNIAGGIDGVLRSFKKIDDEVFDELEEALILADVGASTSSSLVERLRERVKRERITEAAELKRVLREEITAILASETAEFRAPTVYLIVGVNGAGKTTTVGKLANIFRVEGKKVVVAAADTFRAAAVEQLEIWGERANVPVIKHAEGNDPSAVVFDAVSAAKARGADVLLVDTAGRLQNKKNLMEELRKINRVLRREWEGAFVETYLVLDGATGQNALPQARAFKEVTDITGLIVTKLDGTAKGGAVIGVTAEIGVPVRFIGVGEGIDDLQPFAAADFAAALIGEE